VQIGNLPTNAEAEMRKKKREHWYKHGPPWRDREQWADWKHGPPTPPWMRHKKRGKEGWHHSDKRLFARFVVAFGLLVLLGCGVLAILGAMAVLFFRSGSLPHPAPSAREHPLRWLFLLLPLAFLLLLILRRVGALTARRFTEPLSETMQAADALAEGDLSARVSVGGGSREFRRFTHSFNRMAAALETADRQRRELLADVAHELRTPLTVIQGNLEGLRDGVYDATPGHLDLVLDETRKLSRLVDDLRLLTLAEAGQLPLEIQRLNVVQLLADVRDAFAPQADEAGISLDIDSPDSLPPLLADPQRIGQVMGNLVTNALCHTPPGGEVTLGAATVPSHDGVRLWVTDTGEGIPAEDLPRIFDRFWRGDPARSHEAGAGSGPSPKLRTGLGLAIARSLVEAHGGLIGAESSLGQGTTVFCVLPLPDDEA
jgi:two-component system OmpR family sensor kinase/two-component system sensor histidine kinase BaeS